MTNLEKHISDFIEYFDDVVLEEIACGFRCGTCPTSLKDYCSDPTLGSRLTCNDAFTRWAKMEVEE